MPTAGIIIETHGGKAAEVEHHLAVVPGMRILGRTGTCLTGVCAIPDGEALPALLDRIAALHAAIVSVQTTFVHE
ncbi:MAG: hypothetical protein ACTHQM_15885 [Thermoanaerobaculia bacterium]